jgi:hypothetical protein
MNEILLGKRSITADTALRKDRKVVASCCPEVCTSESYRLKRNTPRTDDNTSVSLDSVTALSPPSNSVYALSNAIVGHAARVHANAGPAVRVCPDNANSPLHTLQSTRVDSRPSANISV